MNRDLPQPRDAADLTALFEDFWAFSTSIYAQSEFSAVCVKLQDDYAADVVLLLFILWRGVRGECLSTDALVALKQQTVPWRDEVVLPLRKVRRALKLKVALSNDPLVKELRERIKHEELDAERLEMRMLLRAWQDAPSVSVVLPAQAIAGGLANYQTIIECNFPSHDIKILVDAATSEST